MGVSQGESQTNPITSKCRQIQNKDVNKYKIIKMKTNIEKNKKDSCSTAVERQIPS